MKLAFVLLIILISLSAQAQRKRFVDGYEVFAGVGLLTNHGNQYYNLDSKAKFGGTFGIIANHDVSKLFKIRIGLAFEQKGFHSEEKGLIDFNTQQKVDDRREKTISYLTVSAVPTLQFGKKQKFGFGAGLFYGFRLAAKGTFTRFDENGNVIFKINADYSNSSLTYDFGLTANLSYRVDIGKSAFNLRVQENLGLVEYTESFGYPIKSGMTCFIISYLLP